MDSSKVYFGMPVLIKSTSELFPGKRATVAYIGTNGVSVYLFDNGFDEPVPLKWDEIETVEAQREGK